MPHGRLRKHLVRPGVAVRTKSSGTNSVVPSLNVLNHRGLTTERAPGSHTSVGKAASERHMTIHNYKRHEVPCVRCALGHDEGIGRAMGPGRRGNRHTIAILTLTWRNRAERYRRSEGRQREAVLEPKEQRLGGPAAKRHHHDGGLRC